MRAQLLAADPAASVADRARLRESVARIRPEVKQQGELAFLDLAEGLTYLRSEPARSRNRVDTFMATSTRSCRLQKGEATSSKAVSAGSPSASR